MARTWFGEIGPCCCLPPLLNLPAAFFQPRVNHKGVPSIRRFFSLTRYIHLYITSAYKTPWAVGIVEILIKWYEERRTGRLCRSFGPRSVLRQRMLPKASPVQNARATTLWPKWFSSSNCVLWACPYASAGARANSTRKPTRGRAPSLSYARALSLRLRIPCRRRSLPQVSFMLTFHLRREGEHKSRGNRRPPVWL